MKNRAKIHNFHQSSKKVRFKILLGKKLATYLRFSQFVLTLHIQPLLI